MPGPRSPTKAFPPDSSELGNWRAGMFDPDTQNLGELPHNRHSAASLPHRIAYAFAAGKSHRLEKGSAHMTVAKAEQIAEPDQAAATSAVEQVEGEIRAFVRRDVSVFRRRLQESADQAVGSVNSVIERVS